MADNSRQETATSPDKASGDVADELDQEEVSHQGEWREGGGATKTPEQRGKHLGALENEMVSIVPPMAGPADLVGEKDANAQGNETGQTKIGDEEVDPRRELTPG